MPNPSASTPANAPAAISAILKCDGHDEINWDLISFEVGLGSGADSGGGSGDGSGADSSSSGGGSAPGAQS